MVALPLERFQFAGHIHAAVGVVANIKRNDADGVAGDEERIIIGIVKREGEDAAEPLDERGEFGGVGAGVFPLAVEREDDLTVAARLIVVVGTDVLVGAQVLMVVNLTVDS